MGEGPWSMVGMGTVAARVAGVLAAVGPPAVVVSVWRDAMTNHVVLAAILLVGYEVLIAILLFAGKIITDLRDRWQERIVNRLDRALEQRLTRFAKRYREFVLGSMRYIDLKGLATVGFYTPELDEVFVDVSLAFREPNQTSGGLLATLPTEVTDRHSIQEFLDRPQSVVLAVIGAPGSGKTTLLRHIARQLCRTHRGRRRTVPILLY
ncbi:MAG: NACHT domain-containing protein, partial [Pseudonocardiaceae bacterium]